MGRLLQRIAPLWEKIRLGSQLYRCNDVFSHLFNWIIITNKKIQKLKKNCLKDWDLKTTQSYSSFLFISHAIEKKKHLTQITTQESHETAYINSWWVCFLSEEPHSEVFRLYKIFTCLINFFHQHFSTTCINCFLFIYYFWPQLHVTRLVRTEDALIIQQTPQNVTVKSDGKDNFVTRQMEVRNKQQIEWIKLKTSGQLSSTNFFLIWDFLQYHVFCRIDSKI